MAATGQVDITGSVTDAPSGSKSIGPVTITSAAAVDHQLTVNLASGDNTITVPTGAKACIVIPPTGNTTVVIKLKGAAGDTGFTMAKSMPACLSFDTAPASFVINASAVLAGVVVVFV